MVNFGGHLKAVREGESKGTDLYIVPYNDLKEPVFAQGTDSRAVFDTCWRGALALSNADFTAAVEALFTSIFEADADAAPRGAPLGTAMKVYVDVVGPDEGQDTLQRMVQIHTAALTNSEALRKLVKKHDKYHPTQKLSVSLLPKLYASVVFSGQGMVEEAIAAMRAFLNDEDEGDRGTFLPMKRMDSETAHNKVVESRVEELDWLKRVVASIPETLIHNLVAHRGFHHVKDRNDKRPLENSLAAYETAWTSGIHLCECDIAITRDEKLVLAHDADFKRLALDSKSPTSGINVSDLTFRELISMPLTSGNRPPLLIDVLRSAHAISNNAKLIIEIKPGNSAAASALSRLLLRHPDLTRCVAMIMSFDAVTMHRLRTELTAGSHPLLGSGSTSSRMNLSFGSQHCRFASFDHFGTLPNHHRTHSDQQLGLSLSQNNLGVGMSLSQNTLEVPLVPQEPPQQIEHILSFPPLMLLTVAQKPKRPCEMKVGVHDLSPIDSWLSNPNGCLDGVYLQFQRDMMTPEGSRSLRELSERVDVGVWGFAGLDPDDFDTFHWLFKDCNVKFVNTDLPNNFRKGVIVRSSTSL
mmetsp:Transcript_1833/g.2849  ORF Transcript_1833/g.2849 Transcript_1833/m.2849 type:complete len:582 (+) Transcript_1833:1421-3166(+)